MAKKSKRTVPEAPKAEVPEWIVTFGDMMTLLLCFFILLAAFSELKKDHEYQQVVDAVKEAFGNTGGVGLTPTMDPPLRSLIKTLELLTLESREKMRVSQSDVQGMVGKHAEVKQIREGMVFTIGGNSTFDRASALVKEPVKEDLRAIAKLLAGRSNKIAIRGHCDSNDLIPGARWENLYQLSFARAEAVMQYLTGEVGLSPNVFILEARADTEPLQPRAQRTADQQVNRRVEIILTQSVVADFNSDTHYTDTNNARGG